MNTFDEIINEIARVDCGRVDGIHVIIDAKRGEALPNAERATLREHGVRISFTSAPDYFCLKEPRTGRS